MSFFLRIIRLAMIKTMLIVTNASEFIGKLLKLPAPKTSDVL